MSWEKFTHPLIVVSAIAGLALYFKRSPGNPVSTALINGPDPGRWMGDAAGASTIDQYLAGVPDYAQDPGYIASAAANPYSQDPEADSSVTGTLSAGNGGSIAPYTTYNAFGGNNPYDYLSTQNKPAGSCGCGGGCCESKCKTDCDTGVRLEDGRGMCLASETLIPDSDLVGQWLGYPGYGAWQGENLSA